VNRRGFLVTGATLAGAALYGGRTATAGTGTGKAPSAPARAAAIAVAYARARVGLPYLWGGTGPGAYDCSGLTMMAYLSAGIGLPRTAAEQWAAGPQVGSPRAGDLVFFPGGDGSWSAPGHVAIVTGPGRIVQAYAPGTGIVAASYGQPGSLPGTGPGTVIGYARPWAAP
jgi:cell wall-associated NlpC family hydrolase